MRTSLHSSADMQKEYDVMTRYFANISRCCTEVIEERREERVIELLSSCFHEVYITMLLIIFSSMFTSML